MPDVAIWRSLSSDLQFFDWDESGGEIAGCRMRIVGDEIDILKIAF